MLPLPYRIWIIIIHFINFNISVNKNMRNFIQFNIDNVKGSRKPISITQKDDRTFSNRKTKPKYMNHHRSIEHRVKDIEVQMLNMGERKKESLLLQQISEIKRDVKLIKSYLFGHKHTSKLRRQSEEKQQNFQEQETVYTLARQGRMKSYGSQNDDKQTFQSTSPPRRVYKIQQIIEQKMKRSGGYNKHQVHIKNIYHLLKQYKLDGPEYGTIFFGYTKRNSQPVAIKYSQNSLNNIIEVYDRLWKNIAKAEWPCVNRIYDYKSDDSNVIVMEKNKSNIVGLPYLNILVDIIKILQFIHDCGYLYRNIEPQHFMLNQDGQLVIIDFKRAKRFIDIKGHLVQVYDNIYTGSPFASNNQVRGIPESRKDDLQSIGYLGLLLLQLEIPWGGMNKEQVIKIRSSLSLQQLFKGKSNWIQYMAYVMKLPKNQRPDYKFLCKLISS